MSLERAPKARASASVVAMQYLSYLACALDPGTFGFGNMYWITLLAVRAAAPEQPELVAASPGCCPPLVRPPATTGGAVALAIVPCPALFADRFLADRTLASPSTASESSSALDVFKPRAVIFSCGLPLLSLACTRGAAAATPLSRPMLLAVRLLAAPRPPSTSTGGTEASTSFTQRLLPCARFLLPSAFVPGAVQPANLAFPERLIDRAPTCPVLRWVSAGRMEAPGISSGTGVVRALCCRLCLLPALSAHSAAASPPLSCPKSLADLFRSYPAPPSTSAGAAAIRER